MRFSVLLHFSTLRAFPGWLLHGSKNPWLPVAATLREMSRSAMFDFSCADVQRRRLSGMNDRTRRPKFAEDGSHRTAGLNTSKTRKLQKNHNCRRPGNIIPICQRPVW